MRNFFLTVILLAAGFFAGIPNANGQREKTPTCAVLTFLAVEGVSEGLAKMVSERIATEFGLSRQYRMIERTQTEKVLRENQIAMVSLDTSLAIEAGKIMAAEYIVIGSIGKIGNIFSINSRLVSVESGAVIEIASTDYRGREENVLIFAAVNNARQLLNLPLIEMPDEPEPQETKTAPTQPATHPPGHRGPDTREPPALPNPKSGTPIELAWIPDGNLVLEAQRTRSLRRVVPIRGFWMSKHEITQDQWVDLMGNNPSRFKSGSNPVENIRWTEAVEFCSKLENIINAMVPANEQRLFRVRLPLDTEWEYACRAGTTSAYHSGDTETDLQAVGWYSGNSRKTTHPVGTKTPNRWGLYDMHGNVAEWCDNFSQSRSRRIVKGGSYSDRASRCTADYIDDMRPRRRSPNVGFRIIVIPR